MDENYLEKLRVVFFDLMDEIKRQYDELKVVLTEIFEPDYVEKIVEKGCVEMRTVLNALTMIANSVIGIAMYKEDEEREKLTELYEYMQLLVTEIRKELVRKKC